MTKCATTAASIGEISRLQERQSLLWASQRWAVGATLLLFPLLRFFPIPSTILVVDVIVLLGSIVMIYSLRGKPRTTLSKAQLKLLGLSEASVQSVPPSSSKTGQVEKKSAGSAAPVSSSSSTPSTMLRHRAVGSSGGSSNGNGSGTTGGVLTYSSNGGSSSTSSGSSSSASKQPWSSSSSSPLSRSPYPPHHRLPGSSPHTEPRNFDKSGSHVYAETAWRDISQALDQRSSAAAAAAAAAAVAVAASSSGNHSAVGSSAAGGAYTGFGGNSAHLAASPTTASRHWQTYHSSPPAVSAGLAHHVPHVGAGRLQPAFHLALASKSVASVKAMAALGLPDLSDVWLDQLRFVLGKHLHKTLASFDKAVNAAVQSLRARGAAEPHAEALQTLLELKAERVGAQAVQDAVKYAQEQVNPRLGDEYASLEALLLLPGRRYGLVQAAGTSSTPATPGATGAAGTGGAFAVLQDALARARELNRSPDQFLRIVWGAGAAGSHAASPLTRHRQPTAFGCPGGSSGACPADADLVVSIFLHLFDELGKKLGLSEPPSGHIFADNVSGVLAAAYSAAAASRAGRGGQAQPLVGIMRQGAAAAPSSLPASAVSLSLLPADASSRPHFCVFSADRVAVDLLEVEEGRQNCFASIIVFLLQSLRAAVSSSAVATGSAPGAPRADGGASPLTSSAGMPSALGARYASGMGQMRLSSHGRAGRGMGVGGSSSSSRSSPHRRRGYPYPYSPGQAGDDDDMDTDHHEPAATESERGAALSPVVRELALDVFEMRDLDVLIDYLADKGLDI